jgi:hypothetical protein
VRESRERRGERGERGEERRERSSTTNVPTLIHLHSCFNAERNEHFVRVEQV